MGAFGDLNVFLYFKCLNHALHLAIFDVLYNRSPGKKPFEFIESIEPDENESTDDDDNNSGSGKSDNFSDDSDLSSHEDEVLSDLHFSDYAQVIAKMRKVVKMFRLSPVRNSILQKKIKREIGKELALQLDTPTRWSSLYQSAQRFLRVVNPIMQSLSHKTIDQSNLWSDEDTAVLKVNE